MAGRRRVVAALVQHIGIFCVNHHGHALLSRLFQAGQQLAVIHIERCPLIGQEQLHGGYAHLHQFLDFPHSFVREVVAAGMDGNIRGNLAFRTDI